MNRRDFIKASGATSIAGALLPSWLLPASLRTPSIDLSLFCSDWSTRYDMGRPFLQDGLVYATDAIVGVQVVRRAFDDLNGDATRLPPASTLDWPDADSAGWRSIEEMEKAKHHRGADCPKCYGRGRVGRGVVECPCEYEPFCAVNGNRCNGWTGGVRCGHCDGTGETDYRLAIDGLHFSPSYVAKFATLPGVEVRPAVMTQRNGKQLEILQARFEGGVGLLCSMVVD